MTDYRDLSLYIHIPWCVKKCPYCDFNSHQQKNALPESQYVNRLLEDFENDLNYFELINTKRKIHSIFIGGGTPSLFSAQAIGKILHGINQHITMKSDCEITLEANPGTFEAEKFSGFKHAGINRLSIGVQSFNDQKLEALGRIHNATEARAAIDMAIQAGFENINLDLMYALPEQTLAEALFDIETATAYPITHLSHYQLTLEPNTLFAKFPPDLPNEDDSWVIQKACQEYIHSQGFNQYEVSAYAREGLRSRHNLNYWRFGDYLGIGAGAHGKITHSDNSIIRTAKPRHPTQYLQYAVNEEFMQARQVPDKAIAFEYGLNQLRLYEAFSENDFEQRTGLGFDRIEPILNSAQTKGWIERSHKSITVTPLGKRFMNDLQALFL